MNTSCDVRRHKENLDSPRIDFAPDALPEVHSPSSGKNSNTGVSTNSAQTVKVQEKVLRKKKSWYVLRTTYGREKKAYDYIVNHGGIAYCPTIIADRLQKGKLTKIEMSRIPNIFFAFGTEENIKTFVYDNKNLPYLRFYYRRIREGYKVKKEPLIVPEDQIKSLRIICQSEPNNYIVTTEEIRKFHLGQKVRVLNGNFAGVEGRVARFQGQQRVGIIIEGLLTVITAYIPNAFLEIIDN